MPDVRLSRSDARDPQKYQQGKAEAEKQGGRLVIVDDAAPNGAPARQFENGAQDPLVKLEKVTTLKTERELIATRAAVHDPSEYRRLKAVAEREHLRFVSISDWKDLPHEQQDTLAALIPADAPAA